MSHYKLSGHAVGPVLCCDEGLSFWGGVHSSTGTIIDTHHPHNGSSVSGSILMMPTSRGSCSGSGVLLELILNGHAPAALIFREEESVLTLGALVAYHVFQKKIPVLELNREDYASLSQAKTASIEPRKILAPGLCISLSEQTKHDFPLSLEELSFIKGEHGKASQMAMKILCDIAKLEKAAGFIPVTKVHIDACIYAGQAMLTFADTFAQMGAKVVVPTTMNAISVEYAHWEKQGVDPGFGKAASQLADAYVKMGAKPSFTCAPYLLEERPVKNESIAWAESNAAIYANSILGAKTAKHPDFLDLCISLTGRAPLSGVYLAEHRQAKRLLNVVGIETCDDSFWPLLGYLSGKLSPDKIPCIQGVSHLQPDADDLKAMCAAFGTTSAAPMLHVENITPETGTIDSNADRMTIVKNDFQEIWRKFNSAPVEIDLIAFGSPHFSLSECRKLTSLFRDRMCQENTHTIITLGQDVYKQAKSEGLIDLLTKSGVRIHCDICWCSISEPVFPPETRNIMTNSGKYAHYGPGLSGRTIRFGSLADCVQAACTGFVPDALPNWML